MALGSHTTWQSSCVDPPADIPKKQDELASVSRKSEAGSNKAFTHYEAPTPPLVPFFPSEDLFTKFMKVFIETTHAQAQVPAKLREPSLKAKTPDSYWGKSYMQCYHFC